MNELEIRRKKIVELQFQLKNCKEQNIRLIKNNQKVIDNKIENVFNKLDKLGQIKAIGAKWIDFRDYLKVKNECLNTNNTDSKNKEGDKIGN